MDSLRRIGIGILAGCVAIVILFFATGCAVRTSSGTIFFLQRGVVLQLVHTCTDRARVYQAGAGLITEVTGVTPVDIGLEPPVLGGRQVQVTVQSIDSNGKVVATYTETFRVDNRSTTTQTWVIGNTGRSSRGGRHARCQ